jgi:hypothetical protein
VAPRLEMVYSWRSVGGFHGVRDGSRVFFLPPGCCLRLPGIPSDEVDNAPDDSWRCRFRGVFTWRLSLPTWGVEVEEWATTCTGLRSIVVSRGDRAYLQGTVLSCCN